MDGFLLLLALAAVAVVVFFHVKSDSRPGDSPLDVPPSRPRQPARRPYVTLIHSSLIRGPAWVIDGDTIVINGLYIRLAGIDAPELDHPYGKRAKYALVQLCKGQVVRAELDGTSTHDRPVATCYLPDGRDLSAEMVKLGLAIEWSKFSGGKYRGFEPPDVRRKLWRCDARQKGLMPPSSA